VGVIPLRMKVASVTGDEMKLYLLEGDKHRAILVIEKGKRKARIAVKFVGSDTPILVKCRIKDDEIEEACYRGVADLVGRAYPEIREPFVNELRKVVEGWEDLRLSEELKAEERRLAEGREPMIEEEVEGRIVKVLASDGAYINSYGSYIDLGDYVVIAESTYAYTEVETEGTTLEKIDPVGIAVIYKRDGGSLTPLEKKLYYPAVQTRIQVGDRLVRLRGESREAKSGPIYSFPDITTFTKVLNNEPLGRGWAEVFNEVVSNLREYVVFDDERLYDVVASYVVMTYFYDVFTVVPYLWFHGPPGSGKTRANVTVTYMCRRGLFVADPSDATLYRMAESVGPTLGIDESVLSERAKRILAAGNRKGAVVPRAEPTKEGLILKLFEFEVPRVFSFEHLPTDDYLLQRTIFINMLKSKPRKFMDPQPNEFKAVREALYYLRLTELPEILEAKDKALNMLEEKDVWGREAEIWAPILTAAILAGRGDTVLEYVLEDVARRKANELIYDEEKIVLAAIDDVFSTTPSLVEGEKTVEFMPNNLQEKIIKRLLHEEGCFDINTIKEVNTYTGEETYHEREELKKDQRCVELDRELRRKWNPQKIGKVLKNLGFDKYKNVKGKGGNARRYYTLKYSDFLNIAKRYDYEPAEKSPTEKSEEGEGK